MRDIIKTPTPGRLRLQTLPRWVELGLGLEMENPSEVRPDNRTPHDLVLFFFSLPFSFFYRVYTLPIVISLSFFPSPSTPLYHLPVLHVDFLLAALFRRAFCVHNSTQELESHVQLNARETIIYGLRLRTWAYTQTDSVLQHVGLLSFLFKLPYKQNPASYGKKCCLCIRGLDIKVSVRARSLLYLWFAQVCCCCCCCAWIFIFCILLFFLLGSFFLPPPPLSCTCAQHIFSKRSTI